MQSGVDLLAVFLQLRLLDVRSGQAIWLFDTPSDHENKKAWSHNLGDGTGAVVSAQGLVFSPTAVRAGPVGAALGAVGLDIVPTLITIGATDQSKVALGFSIAPSIIKVCCAPACRTARSSKSVVLPLQRVACPVHVL